MTLGSLRERRYKLFSLTSRWKSSTPRHGSSGYRCYWHPSCWYGQACDIPTQTPASLCETRNSYAKITWNHDDPISQQKRSVEKRFEMARACVRRVSHLIRLLFWELYALPRYTEKRDELKSQLGSSRTKLFDPKLFLEARELALLTKELKRDAIVRR